MRALLLCGLLCVAFPGCGYRIVRDTGPTPTPAPVVTPPNDVVGQRGISMPYKAARDGIAFKPFIPSNDLLDVALLPELRGEDVRANRGIGFEYRSGGVRYALMQWPLNGASIGLAGRPLLEQGCAMSLFMDTGVLWIAKRRIVMTLQVAIPQPPKLPEGAPSPSPTPKLLFPVRRAGSADVINEARRLVRLGACN